MAVLQCIPPLCELLTVQDSKIVSVALHAIENILKLDKPNGVVEVQREKAGLRRRWDLQFDRRCRVEECGGVDRLKELADRDNDGVSQRAGKLLEECFGIGALRGSSDDSRRG